MVVGALATGVHFGVVVGLVARAAWSPLTANVLAWCVAFAVSFFGHWRLSFGTHRAPAWRSVGRFLLVSLLAFGLNQFVYWLLLRAGWNYGLALAVVLGLVAVMTFVVSRHWAFAPKGAR